MKPYYEHAGITIFHGDCREILPTLPKVDLVLTDPPYGIALNVATCRFSGGSTESKNRRGNGTTFKNAIPIAGDDKEFDPSFLIGIGNGHIIWGWNNFASKLPRGACLVWIKRKDEAFGSFLSDAEIAWMDKGHGVYLHTSFPQAMAHFRQHPTQKPISLMAWCMSFYPTAQTILDPFMGSGTTIRAAKDLNRKAIGIEIEEKYCEIAALRMSQEVFAL